MPALPSWLTIALWDQFRALLPDRGPYHPDHPLGCHRRRVDDRIVFDRLELLVLAAYDHTVGLELADLVVLRVQLRRRLGGRVLASCAVDQMLAVFRWPSQSSVNNFAVTTTQLVRFGAVPGPLGPARDRP